MRFGKLANTSTHPLSLHERSSRAVSCPGPPSTFRSGVSYRKLENSDSSIGALPTCAMSHWWKSVAVDW